MEGWFLFSYQNGYQMKDHNINHNDQPHVCISVLTQIVKRRTNYMYIMTIEVLIILARMYSNKG